MIPHLDRLARSVKPLLSSAQPGFVIFYVTNRCNFRCNFCFYGTEIEKGLKPDELRLEEIELIARKLGPLLQLSLTGGEPFLRSEFPDIIHVLLTHTDARYVTIPTNASMPDRMEQVLTKVLPAFPNSFFRVVFSIEGIGEEHDRIRSMPGSYKKIQESFRTLAPFRERFKNLVLDANAVFTARNEDTLLGTLAQLNSEFSFDNLSVTYARGDMKDPSLKQTSREKYIRVNDYLEQLRRTKENRFLYPVWRGVRDISRQNLIRTVFDDEFVSPCVAGQKMIVISETGAVMPCEILGRTVGNLRDHDYDVHKVLASPASTELRKWIVDSRCKCSFECALTANVVWNPSMYPRLALSALRNVGR